MSSTNGKPPEDQTYALEAAPTPPPLPGRIVLRADEEDVIGAIAADLMMSAVSSVRALGDFHLALSGGSTPMPLYRRLMLDPAYRALPWKRTHLWIVDERRVPFSDDKSNFKHIKETIGDHSDIPPEQVHPMMVLEDDAAERYERELREAFAWRPEASRRLDFVVLGMGGDGHTASLFPHSPALAERERWVAVNAGPTVTPPDRVTMTYPLLNGAGVLAALVLGTSKQAMLNRVAVGGDDAATLPIKGIRPVTGELRWYIDHAACG